MLLPLDAGPGCETLWRVWLFPKEILGPLPAVDEVFSPMSALDGAAFVVVTGVERLSKVGVSFASGAFYTGVLLPSDIVLTLLSFFCKDFSELEFFLVPLSFLGQASLSLFFVFLAFIRTLMFFLIS